MWGRALKGVGQGNSKVLHLQIVLPAQAAMEWYGVQSMGRC